MKRRAAVSWEPYWKPSTASKLDIDPGTRGMKEEAMN